MKFCVNYFGCRANQAEIQEWIIDLENLGYQLTANNKEADFGILNTCSVTENAERDVTRFINRTYKKTTNDWIITGCTVTKEKKKLSNRYKNFIFLNNKEKKDIVGFIQKKFPVAHNLIFHSAFRSRIFLKIQDGCNFRCSFCIVPSLRGKSRSLPAEEIIQKAKYYGSLGYKEIVLSGINLSSYGYDLFPRENLLDLVERLSHIRSISLIRLSSLDPRFIKYEFIKGLSNLPKVADSFHFSFQSGSNSVLKRMNRGSKTLDYYKILSELHKFFPNANTGADFIVGFPGETDREYQETLDFIRQSRLNYLHVFPFSPREGTKAALLEPLPQNVVSKRMKEIQELNKAIRIAYREKFMGQRLKGIVIQENDNYNLLVTGNYLSVRTPPKRGFKKRNVKVMITKVLNENICEGRMVK